MVCPLISLNVDFIYIMALPDVFFELSGQVDKKSLVTYFNHLKYMIILSLQA